MLADDTADPAYVAADLISQAEHDPAAASVLVTDSECAGRRRRRRAGQAGRRDPSRRPDPDRARRPAVRDRAGRRPRPGRGRRRRLRRRAPRDPHPRRGGGRRAGPQRRRRSSSARTRRSAWATTAPGPTTCCRRRAAPATPAGCRSAPSCGRCTSSTTPARRSPRSPATWPTLAEAEDLPAHGRAVVDQARGPAGGHPAMTFPPLREELRGLAPYGAPQLSREQAPVQLNVNENPYGRRARPRPPTSPGRWRRRRPASTATPTASSSSCAPRSRPTSTATAGRGSRPTRCGRPTAPTR